MPAISWLPENLGVYNSFGWNTTHVKPSRLVTCEVKNTIVGKSTVSSSQRDQHIFLST